MQKKTKINDVVWLVGCVQYQCYIYVTSIFRWFYMCFMLKTVVGIYSMYIVCILCAYIPVEYVRIWIILVLRKYQ